MKLTPAKVTMLMLVAVAALIGMYIVKGLFAVTKPVERPRRATIPLATAELPPGTKITDTHVGMGPWPERELKDDMLRTTRVIVGRVVKKGIKPGEPLKGSDLYEPGENAPLVVEDGKKAISINVANSADIVDGLVKPGNFVDVHFAIHMQNSGSIDPRLARLGGVSMTLIKGVKVLALNKNFRQGPVQPTGNSVTLELAGDQVNVLLVAQSQGTVTLTYNASGEGDGGISLNNADRATLWDILGLKKPNPRDPIDRDQPFVTETYRGVGANSYQWDSKGKRFDRSAAEQDYNRRVTNQIEAEKNFDPNDVFESSPDAARSAPATPVQETNPDPDIPETRPGTASGVRSRVGSMLRARQQSSSGSAAGPTASRQ